MTNRESLIEQHILQHESHLKHIDEMLRRAHEHVEGGQVPPDARGELQELEGEREKLAEDLTEMKRKGPEDWEEKTIRSAGPLSAWDAVARRLEKLVERLD